MCRNVQMNVDETLNGSEGLFQLLSVSRHASVFTLIASVATHGLHTCSNAHASELMAD